MDVRKLVRMANQIAANFDYGTDKGKAAAATADHLTRFWSPEMRQQIVAHYRQGSNGGPSDVPELSLVATRAVALLAETQQRVEA